MTAAERPQPNDLLRQARLARLSPSGSGLPLSRQELAEAANAWVYYRSGLVVFRDGRYIGRLERGRRHWPQEHYRAALRAVLGTNTDADLGFYRAQPSHTTAHPSPDRPTSLCAACPFSRTSGPDPRRPRS